MYKIVQSSPNQYISDNSIISIVRKGDLASPLYLIDPDGEYSHVFNTKSTGNEITINVLDFSLADMMFKPEQRIYDDAPFCVDFFTIPKLNFFNQLPPIKWLIDNDIDFRIKSWTPNTMTIIIQAAAHATMFKTKFT